MRELALKLGWVDQPDARKVHSAPIPRVGGLAIAAAWFMAMAAVGWVDNAVGDAWRANPDEVIGLFIGAGLIVVLGLVDDVRGLGAWPKLAWQVGVASLMYAAFDYRIELLGNPMGPPFELGLLAYPVTVLWFVAIINAINLIDGLDGLAGGVALIASCTLFVVCLLQPVELTAYASIALAGAVLGFLLYNFNPASIFMGDSGSLFLGFALAATSLQGSVKSRAVVAILVPVIALGVPFMDTLLAVVRRVLAGRSLFAADKGHVHHRLLALGFSHRRTVLMLYSACLLCALVALALVLANSRQAAVLLTLYLLVAALAVRALGIVDFAHIGRTARHGLLRRRHMVNHLASLQAAGVALRGATTVDEAMERLVGWARGSDLSRFDVRLVIGARGGVRQAEVQFARHGADVSPAGHEIEIPVDWALGDVTIRGDVRFGWAVPASELHLPEAPVYEWLAMVLRDRVLEIAFETGPRMVVLPRGQEGA